VENVVAERREDFRVDKVHPSDESVRADFRSPLEVRRAGVEMDASSVANRTVDPTVRGEPAAAPAHRENPESRNDDTRFARPPKVPWVR
jgi:hypothetical protein